MADTADAAREARIAHMRSYMNWFMALVAAGFKGLCWGAVDGVRKDLCRKTAELSRSRQFQDALKIAYDLGEMHLKLTGTSITSEVYIFDYFPNEVIALMNVIEEAKRAKEAGNCSEMQESLLMFLEDKRSVM